MKKLTLHRVHRVTRFAQVKQRDKQLNGINPMEKEQYFKELALREDEIFKIEKELIDPIKEQIKVLKQKMVDACPFIVGDKVSISVTGYGQNVRIEEFYIKTIGVSARPNSIWSCEGYEFDFLKTKKDGTTSKNKGWVHPRLLSDIKKI